ncbi:MFS transporter [Arthrobacter bambusae]|uniref:MFS transporter n=1 Tax=Arthrobacter bambusae TaxID=1338426 RepID=UPI00277EE925|nr:MFS family permease [Arthrobacter bambusae]MDQ0098544.1 MFS family permease [Arthrobacter bambusae]
MAHEVCDPAVVSREAVRPWRNRKGLTPPNSAPLFNIRGIAVPAFGPGLLFSLGQGAILPVVALSALQLGASVAMAAVIVTLIGLGSWVFNLPASMITLKFGERWSIVSAAAAGALAMVAAAVSSYIGGLWLLAVAMTGVGMATAVFTLARQKYLTEAVPVEFRGRAMSTLGGVIRIGTFIGPFIGAAVITLVGTSGAYWVGVAGMSAAGVLAASVPDPVLGEGSECKTGPEPTLRAVLVSHSGVFLTAGAGILLLSALRASRQVVIPLWAGHLGLDPTHASLVYGLSGAIDMLVFYPAGRVMDRRGRQWVAIPSSVIMGAALEFIPLTAGFTSLLLVALLIGFGNGISSGLVMTLGADFSPDRGRGQFLGLWRFMADAGSTCGPMLLSAVTAATTLGAGATATGVLGFAAAGLFGRRAPQIQSPPQSLTPSSMPAVPRIHSSCHASSRPDTTSSKSAAAGGSSTLWTRNRNNLPWSILTETGENASGSAQRDAYETQRNWRIRSAVTNLPKESPRK